MRERNWSPVRLIIGAGLLAVTVVGVAAFVPKRRLGQISDALAGSFRLAAKSPLVSALSLWAVNLWNDAAPRAPVFDDLRPFDEF